MLKIAFMIHREEQSLGKEKNKENVSENTNTRATKKQAF